MMRYLPLALLTALAVCAWIAEAAIQTRPVTFSIGGRVVDSAGKPASNVEILVVAQDLLKKRGYTNQDGTYQVSVKLDSDTAVTVLFDGPNYRPGVIQAVSGSSKHSVTKVMLKPEDPSDNFSRAIEDAATISIGRFRTSS